jgi:transposase
MAGRTRCWPSRFPGRPSKVNAEELSWIANAVRDHNPQQFKFEFGLWTLSLIRHLIKRQFKKELSVSERAPEFRTAG